MDIKYLYYTDYSFCIEKNYAYNHSRHLEMDCSRGLQVDQEIFYTIIFRYRHNEKVTNWHNDIALN